LNIAIIGLGYVGLANALHLSERHHVVGYDIDNVKTVALLKHEVPISDRSIIDKIRTDGIHFDVARSLEKCLLNCDMAIIATPTDFDERTGQLNVDSIVKTIDKIKALNKTALIVIRSTVPIGTIAMLRTRFNDRHIAFMPEFLREGSAYSDTCHPNRIVIGSDRDDALIIKDAFVTEKGAAPVFMTTPAEAEAIKLLSNSYLALRVAFYNELDGLSLRHGMNTRTIIEAMGSDPRIGMGYNNPSFGFSGYCLPKDSKQLSHHFNELPHEVISSINKSNQERISSIVRMIMAGKPAVIGVYRLISKSDSSDFRHAVINEVIKRLPHDEVTVVIHEPLLKQPTYDGYRVISDLNEFITMSDIVIANRVDGKIKNAAKEKLFTRDVFNTDK